VWQVLTNLPTIFFNPYGMPVGNFSNVVLFTSNGGASTNRVLGFGLTPPQLSVSPPNWDFGAVAVGSSDEATFVVTNLGGAPLSNGVATISAGPQQGFSRPAEFPPH